MNLTGFFVSAVIILLVSAAAAAVIDKKPDLVFNRVITPFKTVFAGFFAAEFILLLPVFGQICSDQPNWLKTILFAVQGTIKVFTADADPQMILENIDSSAGGIAPVYSVALSVLFAVSPILTFGFVLSFFRNASAMFSFFLMRRKEMYVFSELNEKSLALSSDIRSRHPDCAIVFTDVFDNNEEKSYELIIRAKKLDAICIKKDILALNLKIHSRKKPLYLFVIGADETENIGQALKLKNMYGSVPDSHLYVFTTRTESELLLSNNQGLSMKIRRINEVRSLINRVLYERGNELFENAVQVDEKTKKIHAVIAGLGSCGTEMLKALVWYCQMDGYEIEIDAFDRDIFAEERFAALCPELMSDKYNGVHIPEEAEYTVRIHSGVDTETKTFSDMICGMNDVTYAFVALGSDERNVKASVTLRMLLERSEAFERLKAPECSEKAERKKPVIHAVIRNSDEKAALAGITNYRGQEYNIECIGDLNSSFSENVIIDSELERFALERHLKWGKEEEFWSFEYNYRSSVASAIHLKARSFCKIPGADKTEEQLTDEERTGIEQLEHRRWNAYMRAEGYIYSGSPDKSSRNDLAKMHHDLVDYSTLSDEDKRKDCRLGSV